ncbi:MAG: hypothetical protein KDB22_24060 [Planctomycetales bacterium]|nr:hypothetical protein [Planctomycetales bacterium]
MESRIIPNMRNGGEIETTCHSNIWALCTLAEKRGCTWLSPPGFRADKAESDDNAACNETPLVAYAVEHLKDGNAAVVPSSLDASPASPESAPVSPWSFDVTVKVVEADGAPLL